MIIRQRRAVVACLALLGVTAASPRQQPPAISGFTATGAARQRAVESALAGLLSRDTVGATFRVLTAEPHAAGTARNKWLADWLAEKWRAYGLEDVKLHRYDVYLPWPKDISVTMTAPQHYEATFREDPIAADPDTRLDPGPTYLGMSASTDVTGELIYASSGNPADYDWLESQGISVKGKIAVVRYSVPYSYRGYKAQVAEQRGVKALLIYSDPQEDGYRKGLEFPDGPYGPPAKIQRGALTYDFIVPGDPLTPGWPSLPGERRIPVGEARSVPTIAMVPLSWRDAKPLLAALGGPVAPATWQGALPITYRVGPGPATVHVNVQMEQGASAIRPIWVVEGRVRGAELPDEYVMVGNHRDAWVFGGVDPSSGTATQLELARALGQLARDGKRPRRTILFASWDAEEWHLTGSTEWGEQFADELSARGVAYLNVDGSTSGPDFSAGAVASLNRLVIETVRDTRDPARNSSVLDAWLHATAADRVIGGGATNTVATRSPFDLPGNALGSGSDYTVFLNHLGLPVVEMSFSGPYGVYHSLYDDYYWMTHFGDPGFRYMTAMSEIWGRMALRLANADELPVDMSLYASRVGGFMDAMASQPGVRGNLDITVLRTAQRRWTNAARSLDSTAMSVLSMTDAALRTRRLARINDALRAAEQQLLLAEGIPGRPWFRHSLYAPKATYAAMTLPGVQEAIDDTDWVRARAQVAALAQRINALAASLERATRP